MMMHIDDDDLQLLLDQEHPAPDPLAKHIADCADCRRRLERYQALRAGLRNLPQAMSPQRDLFPNARANRQVAGHPFRRWAGRAVIAAAIYGVGVLTGSYGRDEGSAASGGVTSIGDRMLDIQHSGGAFASGLVRLAATPGLDDRQREAIREMALGTILSAAAELRAMTPGDSSLIPVVQNVAIAHGALGATVPNLNRVTF